MLKIECEGTDGAGKTTALKYFIEQAQKRGLSTVETREVGNPHVPICVGMREAVLDPNSGLSGEAMEIVFSAMRMFNDTWLKNLAKSDNPPDLVVSDRGWFSHLAYTDHNVSTEFTRKLYMELMLGMTDLPDVVIYFDVNTDTALKRRTKRGTGMDVIELKGVPFQEKVRESFEKYLDESEDYSDIQIFVVDANQDLDNVKLQMDEILTSIEYAVRFNESSHELANLA